MEHHLWKWPRALGNLGGPQTQATALVPIPLVVKSFTVHFLLECTLQ